MTGAPVRASATAPRLRRSLSQFGRRMRALRGDHGVSAAKLSVLGQLERAGVALTASELADRERLRPQSLTRIIADLERRGYIDRRVDDRDRRRVEIVPTASGRALIRDDARRQDAWIEAAMRTTMTAAEIALLDAAAALIERLASAPDV